MPLDTFQLGEPVEHRGIVVAPLFPRRDPVAEYVTLDEALPRGFRVDEASDAGTVPELVVHNPTDARVLLYDGEELVGAKQDRILNVTVLVEAGAKLPIPVSCVEQGRWRRTSSAFGSGDHISHSHLRRMKAQAQAAQPLARGVAQGEVWDEVRAKQSRMGVRSATAANRDTFVAHGERLRELEAAFLLQPGQCGAVLGLGDDLCLDAVSRPDAFAAALAEAPRRLPARRARAARQAGDLGRARLAVRRRRRRGAGHARPVGRARRRRAPAGGRRDRLRARARRRAAPALGVHERRRGRAGVRADRAAEPAALDVVAGLVRREEGPPRGLAGGEALLGQPAAVDRQGDAVHVGGLVAREVERGVGDVVRDADAALRDDGAEPLLERVVARSTAPSAACGSGRGRSR